MYFWCTSQMNFAEIFDDTVTIFEKTVAVVAEHYMVRISFIASEHGAEKIGLFSYILTAFGFTFEINDTRLFDLPLLEKLGALFVVRNGTFRIASLLSERRIVSEAITRRLSAITIDKSAQTVCIPRDFLANFGRWRARG